jgi:hypothetical protein
MTAQGIYSRYVSKCLFSVFSKSDLGKFPWLKSGKGNFKNLCYFR